MSLVYITGISGSGKSEVRKELKRRGHIAYGTDEDDIAAHYNNETDERLPRDVPISVDVRTMEWRQRHTWKMPRERIAELAAQSNGSVTFLCGVAENENEAWDLFDQVFALVIDDETLRRRITLRQNNDFGKSAHEMALIWEWQRSTGDAYRKFGHVTVDATRPVEVIVDEILAEVRAAGVGSDPPPG